MDKTNRSRCVAHPAAQGLPSCRRWTCGRSRRCRCGCWPSRGRKVARCVAGSSPVGWDRSVRPSNSHPSWHLIHTRKLTCMRQTLQMSVSFDSFDACDECGNTSVGWNYSRFCIISTPQGRRIRQSNARFYTHQVLCALDLDLKPGPAEWAEMQNFSRTKPEPTTGPHEIRWARHQDRPAFFKHSTKLSCQHNTLW